MCTGFQNVRDKGQRRKSKHIVRTKPASTLIELRDEAIRRSDEKDSTLCFHKIVTRKEACAVTDTTNGSNKDYRRIANIN